MSGDYAAVVAGGGPAGAASAILLATLGHRVLLVDDSASCFKLGEALAPAARPLLRDLGVLERFLADGHLPCHGNVSAWGSSDAHATDFVFNPHGHGWHLDRARFDTMLREAARDCGATVLSGGRVIRVENKTENRCVTIQIDAASRQLERVRTAWLIDATGRRAAVGRRLGAKRIQVDRLVVFYARFRSGCAIQDQDSRTFVEAAPDGWWYTALVPSGERVVAFLTDSDLADRTALHSAQGFTTMLQASRLIGRLLTETGHQPFGAPRGANAGTARLDHFGGPGWLAVGDAAISLDPLSSQGILNALYTGIKAGQAVASSLSGDRGLVSEYLRRLDSIYNAYRTNRTAYYAGEGRWRDRPFWCRRAVEQ